MRLSAYRASTTGDEPQPLFEQRQVRTLLTGWQPLANTAHLVISPVLAPEIGGRRLNPPWAGIWGLQVWQKIAKLWENLRNACCKEITHPKCLHGTQPIVILRAGLHATPQTTPEEYGGGAFLQQCTCQQRHTCLTGRKALPHSRWPLEQCLWKILAKQGLVLPLTVLHSRLACTGVTDSETKLQRV